jgi:hypothetical protein
LRAKTKIAELALNPKSFKIFAFGFSFILLVIVSGCDPFNSNSKHPSDDKLMLRFQKNESSFNKLVAMSTTDSKVIRIAFDFTWLESSWAWPRPDSELGFSKERWDEYRDLFRKLGLKDGISRQNNSNGPVIFFTASSKGMTFRGSSKGFAYSVNALSPTFDSLDQIDVLKQKNQEHGDSYKKIKDNWYLYYSW